MNRRNVMLAMSGLAVPVLLTAAPRLALAQTQTSATTGEPIGLAKHKMMTLNIGTFSKQISELAQTMATRPMVKQFAGFEVAEQTTIAQVLTDMQNPPPAPLSQMQMQQMDKLKAASGAAFDRAYLQAQIQGHEELLRIQQAFLDGQHDMATDPVHVAMLARTVIQMHLTMLNDLAAGNHA